MIVFKEISDFLLYFNGEHNKKLEELKKYVNKNYIINGIERKIVKIENNIEQFKDNLLYIKFKNREWELVNNYECNKKIFDVSLSIGLYSFNNINNNELIIKKTKTCGNGINIFNGLNKKHSYQLEKECLLLLNKNFECICEKKMQHFPVIFNCDDDNCIFLLSHCGKLIKELRSPSTKKIEKKLYKHKNLYTQVDCILYNLKKNKIKHLDMDKGKNLCLNKSGVVSLIDFDIAIINDNPLSGKIKNNPYNINNYYELYYKTLLNHLKYFEKK